MPYLTALKTPPDRPDLTVDATLPMFRIKQAADSAQTRPW